MKKLVTTLVAIALCVALVFSFVACQNETSATAYGYVHGGYAATATVSKDDTTDSGYKTTFNEYYLPSNWANAKIDGAETASRQEKIMVGDRIWTIGTTKFDTDNGFYVTENSINVREFIKDPVNAEWYVKQVIAGKFWVLDADGNKVDDAKVSTFNVTFGGVTLNKTDSLNKAKNGYWPAGATTPEETNWNKQINQGLAGWLDMYGYAFSMKDVKSSNPNGFTIGGGYNLIIGDRAVSGVTAVDSRDYLVLAFVAYTKLVA